MAADISDLLKKALALPVEARAAPATSLIESLDDSLDESAEAAWEQEITRRVSELKEGTVQTIRWSEVRRMLIRAVDGERA